MEPNNPIEPIQSQPLQQPINNQFQNQPPIQNVSSGFSIKNLFKVIGFFILGLFVFYISVNNASISLPLGFLIGLILIIFKSKRDKIIRFIALLLGFIILLYSPFVSSFMSKYLLSKVTNLNSVYGYLEKTFPNSNISISAFESGITVQGGSNMPIQAESTPTQLSVTLTQSTMISTDEIQQALTYICSNSKYNMVNLKNVKMHYLIIPLPFTSTAESISKQCVTPTVSAEGNLHIYPNIYKQNFMNICVQSLGGEKSKVGCQCILDKLQKTYTYTQAVEFDQKYAETKQTDSGVKALVQSCLQQ